MLAVTAFRRAVTLKPSVKRKKDDCNATVFLSMRYGMDFNDVATPAFLSFNA